MNDQNVNLVACFTFVVIFTVPSHLPLEGYYICAAFLVNKLVQICSPNMFIEVDGANYINDSTVKY